MEGSHPTTSPLVLANTGTDQAITMPSSAKLRTLVEPAVQEVALPGKDSMTQVFVFSLVLGAGLGLGLVLWIVLSV